MPSLRHEGIIAQRKINVNRVLEDFLNFAQQICPKQGRLFCGKLTKTRDVREKGKGSTFFISEGGVDVMF